MNIRYLIGLIIAGFMVAGCSGSDSAGTYIRFTIDGQSYETPHATISVADLNRADWKFVGIGKDVARGDAFDAPSASLQWRMELTDLSTLEGQTIAIRNLNDSDMADPIISFVLPGDVTVANMSSTNASVTITSVTGQTVEGSFRTRNLDYLAIGREKTTDVEGTFRARLLD